MPLETSSHSQTLRLRAKALSVSSTVGKSAVRLVLIFVSLVPVATGYL